MMMSRTNIILLGVLVAVVGVLLLAKDWGDSGTTGPAPRLFPKFNKEAADQVEISGGWQGSQIVFAKRGSDWVLASAGNYEVKSAEMDTFLDAVYNLRGDNVIGSRTELRGSTHTDEKNGRRVRILRGGAPMADFFVGKTPKRGYEEVYVRKDGGENIYRVRTILSKDRGGEISADAMGGPRGFEWHSYIDKLATKWVKTNIWDLGDAEPVEVWLTRRDKYEVKLVKKGEDKWDLVEAGQPTVPADADAAEGILDNLRRVSLYEVLGPYEDAAVRKEAGLEAPEITVVMKLRKKIEKKEEPKPAGGDEKKEGEAKEGEEKKEGEGEKKEPKEEYITINRVLEVGQKFERKSYRSYDDKFETEDYYAIRVGPEGEFEDAGEANRAKYVFLVDNYKVSGLRKNLDELRAKAPEKDEEKADDGDEPDDTGTDDAGKKDETPGDKKDAKDEGAGDKKDEEPSDKKDEGADEGSGEGTGTDTDSPPKKDESGGNG